MIATPLEVPIHQVPSERLVWIQRYGLVYAYPAGIVRDIANDLYATDQAFDPSTTDREAGWLLAEHYGRRTNVTTLRALAQTVWRSASPTRSADQAFDFWWDSVDQSACASLIGAAAAFAARNVHTYPLFRHRYMIDTPAQSL